MIRKVTLLLPVTFYIFTSESVDGADFNCTVALTFFRRYKRSD